MDFTALIFDLDGTILDNNAVYESAFREVLKEIGGKTFNEPLPTRGSIGVGPNWPILIEKYGVKAPQDIKKLTQRTQEEYLRNLQKVGVRDGFFDFVKKAKSLGIRMSLATSNEKEVTDICLKEFSLDGIFEQVVTLEDVKETKPAPDIFLKALDRLAVLPIESLVIEDAEAGIKASHAAGIRVACLLYENEKEDTSLADITFKSYRDLINQLFSG
jgi:HAD superfamily hydrolase (TIGR01509 family)